MTKYSLPSFEELDLENLKDYYDVEIDFNGQKVEIDLNFESNSIDSKYLDIVKHFMDNIVDFDGRNKKYMEHDYANEDGNTVRTYVEHHLEEIDKEELSRLIDFDNRTINPEIQLMGQLKLVRIGFYPDSQDQFTVFDYSIGQDLTQYIVVIVTDQNGDLNSMAMES